MRRVYKLKQRPAWSHRTDREMIRLTKVVTWVFLLMIVAIVLGVIL
jgi:hypothetical protein